MSKKSHSAGSGRWDIDWELERDEEAALLPAVPLWRNYDAAMKLAAYLLAAKAGEQTFNVDDAGALYALAIGRTALMPPMGRQLDRLLDEFYWGQPEERLDDLADDVVAQRELAVIEAELGEGAVA